MPSNSSFYADGETYDTSYTTPGDVPGATEASQAPSGFYPEGETYEQANPDTAFSYATQAAASAASAASHDASSATHDTNSANSAAAALASQNAAATSATNASNSATAAASSASSAATHDTSAGTHDTNAANSATAAASSASSASTSATNAANSASAASTSATNASTSATNAANSASSAATSASNAASAVQAAAGTATPLVDGTAAVGTGTKWAHEDHVHPTDTTRAPLASPGFTGTPTAPTPAVNDNSTKIATTAYVEGQASSANPVMNGTAAPGTGTKWAREDHVHPTDTTRAPLASPGFTGTPTAPTAAVGTNTTQLATTAFVLANGASGVQGQCKLALSGSNLLLSPKNGNLLTINGVNYAVPDAGVSLAPTGLTAGTTYFIYAYMSSGTMTLEAVTTAHVTSTTAGNKGVEIKSGDDTRTLVGMARPVSGPAWADSATQRFVRSWFNDRGVEQLNWVSAGTRPTVTSVDPTYTEIGSYRIETLLWASERWILNGEGTGWLSTSGGVYMSISVDGGTYEPGGVQGNSSASGMAVGLSPQALKTSLSEGYHYAACVGAVSSGTASYTSSSVDSVGCSLRGETRRD